MSLWKRAVRSLMALLHRRHSPEEIEPGVMPDLDATELARVLAMLDVLELRRRLYCPRCDRVTLWWNSCRDGVHKHMKCNECDLEEAGRLTEAETARMAIAAPDDLTPSD